MGILQNKDEVYMHKAIELAKKGWGKTNPNPLVGAVIVKDDRVIGEGFHEVLGCAHAEISALNNAKEDVEGSIIYVNLEPCSHFGRTPPCAEAIIRSGIKKVVIGMVDPNPKVAGRGIRLLRENGIEVACDVLKNESEKLNEIFIKYITNRKPYVIMKTAMTLDGKINTYTGDSKWITGEKSRQYVHKLRDRVSAIMVGINTITKDNPYLTTRLDSGKGTDPVRIIVDSNGIIPINCNVVNAKSNAGTIVATTWRIERNKELELINKGVRVIKTDTLNGRVDLNILMDELYKLEIDSVLLEGGGTLNAASLEAGIVDKVISFIAPKIIGGVEAATPVEGLGREFMKDAIVLRDIYVEQFDNDIMIEGYI